MRSACIGNLSPRRPFVGRTFFERRSEVRFRLGPLLLVSSSKIGSTVGTDPSQGPRFLLGSATACGRWSPSIFWIATMVAGSRGCTSATARMKSPSALADIAQTPRFVRAAPGCFQAAASVIASNASDATLTPRVLHA